ncbi:NAD(P)-binding protein [Punctularia strigosozonata HHB-11173 SS5]|uniref:NAD(P)-binding protein n=1 Tax=Punctularia strigosozonata (strain HHB-11173) TaxID=741275 RepID=R7S4H4_PUNST|nr:NAD(P)-binding protein [Punctularia strigosozonata HHB-11173 SS5]EIN04702.1 NAD(P)-binding protein [Punctularia strigosozonata HHB-11173 SS5]
MGSAISFVTHDLPAFIGQTFPPAAKWSTDQIPDLTGFVCIVTGGNIGIGKETVKALLQHNAKVYLAARSQQRADEAIKDLQKDTGKEAIFLKLDLSDLKAIKAAAEEFLSKETKLHILFNNAGVMSCPVDLTTADGYDLQFGTNVLGHFYFTKLLLPTLLSTAETAPKGTVRIINTSSAAHYMSGLDFATFKDGPKRRKQNTDLLYCQSKLGNVVFTNELVRRYADKGLISISAHPGVIRSNLWQHSPKLTTKIMGSVMHPASKGALTQLYAGTAPEAADLNGKYLGPWAKEWSPKPLSNDPKLGKELWTWLEEQVKDL